LLTATFFGRRPTVGYRHSLCREPGARLLDKEPWPRKKFSVSPVPSATVSKAFADGLLAFAESFRLSAKPGFLVVRAQNADIMGATTPERSRKKLDQNAAARPAQHARKMAKIHCRRDSNPRLNSEGTLGLVALAGGQIRCCCLYAPLTLFIRGKYGKFTNSLLATPSDSY
jgi:hypothetical protein